MFGLVEIITLLMGLSNFSLQANPKPPTVEAALQYGLPDADVVIHIDAATFVPNNYKALMQLSSQPQIKASPELSKMVRELVAEVDGMRGIAKSAVGIDPTTDISDATIFVQAVPRQEPNFVATVHGKFAAASIDKIAKFTGAQPAKIGGGVMVELGGSQPAIGLTKDGVLLAGTAKLVRERLADTWKAPARTPGSSLGVAAEMIAGKPVLALSMTLSPTARKAALDELGPKKNFLTEVVRRHKSATFSAYHDGVGWTWVDSDKAGLDSMVQISEGAMDLMRAGQVAPRGVAKILLGALDSYRGTSPQVDELIKRKADLWKIVEAYTGDGNFKVKIDKNPATLRLDARATGKTLSEVVPAGLVLPIGAVFLTAGGGRKKPVESFEAQPPMKQVPATKQAPPMKQPAPPAKQPAPKPAAPAARP